MATNLLLAKSRYKIPSMKMSPSIVKDMYSDVYYNIFLPRKPSTSYSTEPNLLSDAPMVTADACNKSSVITTDDNRTNEPSYMYDHGKKLATRAPGMPSPFQDDIRKGGDPGKLKLMPMPENDYGTITAMKEPISCRELRSVSKGLAPLHLPTGYGAANFTGNCHGKPTLSSSAQPIFHSINNNAPPTTLDLVAVKSNNNSADTDDEEFTPEFDGAVPGIDAFMQEGDQVFCRESE
ncbi:hypothetical protein SEMRO_782_G201800.1 [Seminavis robusta]|uniref:Uncharacterized protein n=1 Tax=Seminavis robusta TaxID=568900 RepID=A0A9N8E8D4_9STRA|nr:hypothetical protein SEMRO_782_G201800.1 [Seminavis robusta]|eukprot:Sro782_g201800.1 n/a (236) ;mRNA; f:41747-42454